MDAEGGAPQEKQMTRSRVRTGVLTRVQSLDFERLGFLPSRWRRTSSAWRSDSRIN